MTEDIDIIADNPDTDGEVAGDIHPSFLPSFLSLPPSRIVGSSWSVSTR